LVALSVYRFRGIDCTCYCNVLQKGLQFVLAGFNWSVSIVCLLVIQKIMQKGLQFGSCFAKILSLDFILVNSVY
jgi:hypothetical protein